MEFDYKPPRSNNEIVTLREKVNNSSWPLEKKKVFADFQNYLVATDKSKRTQVLYSISVHKLGEFVPKKLFKKYSEKDMMNFKTKLMETYSPYTIHNRMLDVITFYKWHFKTKEKPESLDWYNVSEQNKKSRKKHNGCWSSKAQEPFFLTNPDFCYQRVSLYQGVYPSQENQL